MTSEHAEVTPLRSLEDVDELLALDDPEARRAWVLLEGPLNFRDLGGYESEAGGRVRRGMIFRSDDLAAVSDRDLDRLRPLGLRTVLDLRSREEVAKRGRFPVERYRAGTRYHHLSVVEDVVGRRERGQDDRNYVLSRYRHLLTGGAPSIRQAFAIFAQPESYPLVFHCVAGKDRTGVLAALLLAVLRVPDEQIVEDYHRTDLATRAWFARQQRTGQDPAELLADVPAVLFVAMPHTMRALLGIVRSQHGSVEGYLRGIGVTDQELDRIREVLLVSSREESTSELG